MSAATSLDEDGNMVYQFDNYSIGSLKKIYEKREPASGGPKGLGDPFDRELSAYELDPLLPQRMHDIVENQLCVRELEDINSTGSSLFNINSVWELNKKIEKCQDDWFHNRKFQEAVKEEYLNERSHYRQTGLITSRYIRGKFAQRNLQRDPLLDSQGDYRPQKPNAWDKSYPDEPPSWSNFKYN